MKARKKPVEIDYFPLVGEKPNYDELKIWVELFGDNFEENFIQKNQEVKVKTLEGSSYNINSSHVVIRGIKGEYYPCEKEIFFITYDTIQNQDYE
jgi:hypothetical protein